MSNRLDHAGETLRICGSTADGNSAAQRQPQTITSSRDYSETNQRVFQLKPLNSTSICYVNSTVISWLHAFSCTACTEHEIFGSKVQAWRDVLYATRPIHVHSLASWRSVVTGWNQLHRQHGAGEMLEHWVVVGRPQVVAGRWEARIEQQSLIEIRHSAITQTAVTPDIPHAKEPTGLQHLVLGTCSNLEFKPSLIPQKSDPQNFTFCQATWSHT